jgi:hypothetical protein
VTASAPGTAPDAIITAVGVVIPARDEQERIAACLHSVRRALDALPAGIAAAVTIVLDRCFDATPDLVASLLTDWPEATSVTSPPPGRSSGPEPPGAVCLDLAPAPSVGTLRHLGVHHVLDRLADHPVSGTWLLSTDADTTVPADWALAHLHCARAGVHAVAGLADLGGTDHLSPTVRGRYCAILKHGRHGGTHTHVYGANLGVRADAYLAVGGFPRRRPGEDRGLWHRLHAAGYALHQPVDIRVRTSARLHGRASDGLADLLRSLHHAHPSCGGHAYGEPVHDCA